MPQARSIPGRRGLACGVGSNMSFFRPENPDLKMGLPLSPKGLSKGSDPFSDRFQRRSFAIGSSNFRNRGRVGQISHDCLRAGAFDKLKRHPTNSSASESWRHPADTRRSAPLRGLTEAIPFESAGRRRRSDGCPVATATDRWFQRILHRREGESGCSAH